MRKHRSDSIITALDAFQRTEPGVPAHIHLRACDVPFWRAAIACRDDWKNHELDLIAQLSRAMADGERLHHEIAQEGEIINGRPNLKFSLAETLSRRAMSLTRILQIHARATRGEARDAARRPPAPRGPDDDLIPRIR